MIQCTEVVADGAAAVVVKRATGAAVPVLQAEGERLRAAAHPGVVEVLASSGTEDGWELRLAHAGRAVDVGGPLPVARVAGLIAAVAATLADLHDGGIVHGRIDPSHVLLGRHGRPVLCGFGGDPAGMTPADDVGALGSVLAALLGSGADMEPIPDRRWWPRRSWAGWERRSLLLLADQACAEPPTRRPTARRLAAAIAEAVPTVAVPEARDDDGHRAPSARGRVPGVVCAVAGVLLLGVGTLRIARPSSPPAQALAAPIAPPTTAPASSTASTDRLPTTTTALPSPPCVRPSGRTTGGDGCVAPVRVDGHLVLVGTRRYEVGQPGDLVVLGDWDCDGGATPAAMRPATGEVFVFTAWSTGPDVVVHATARVPGAASLVVGAGPAGCSALLIERRDGTRVPVTATGRGIPTERVPSVEPVS